MWKVDKKKHPKLVKTLDIVSFILKIISCICFGIVILCVVCKCAYDKSSSAASGYISAKADEGVAETALSGDEMNASINDFDITNYPTANLINFDSSLGEEKFYDLSVKQCTDGTILVDGTIAYQEDGRAFKSIGTVTLSPGIYTLSGAPTGYPGMTGLVLANIGTDTGNGLTFTISSTQTIILYIAIAHDLTFDNVIWSPMVNSGSVAYPYIPPLDFVYNAGYNDAMDVSSYGFLVGSTVSATATYNYAEYGSSIDEIVREEHIPVNYFADLVLSNGGFDLSQVYTYFENNRPIIPPEGTPYIYTWTDFSLKLRFGQPLMVDYFENNYYFRSYGNFFVGYSSMLICENFDGSGNVYRAGLYVYPNQGEGTDYNPQANTFKITTTSLPSSITNISDYYVLGIDISSSSSSLMPTAALDLYSFYVKDGLFAYGYNQGFNDGMVSGQAFKDGYNQGFNDGAGQGYDDGFVEGKEIGYNDGLSVGFQDGFNQNKSGGFGWLISSVQAFLDVKFFGDFGIGTLLYVGLGITLVTLFLKMFAGG